MLLKLFDAKLKVFNTRLLFHALRRHLNQHTESGTGRSHDPADPAVIKMKTLLAHTKLTGCDYESLRLLTDLLSNHMDYAVCMQSCDLSGNTLTRLPDTISCWTHMERLSLAYNELTSLPETVAAWSTMRKLDLTGNKLSTLPNGIGSWTRIEELDLTLNRINTLPETVAGWVRLKNIRLTFNLLQTLPSTVSYWSEIEVVSVWSNQLTSLPEDLSRWANLRQLFLKGNLLTADTNTLAALAQLQILYQNSNKLTPQVITLGDNPLSIRDLNHILPTAVDNYGLVRFDPQHAPNNPLLQQWQDVRRLFFLLIWTAARHNECNITQALWLLEPIVVRIVAMAVFGNLDVATVNNVERFVERNITPTKISLSRNIMDVRTYRIQPMSITQTTHFCMELFRQPTTISSSARLAAHVNSPPGAQIGGA